MMLVISRRGLSLAPTPPGLRRRGLLRVARLTAVAFAAAVVGQTALLFALDAVL